MSNARKAKWTYPLDDHTTVVEIAEQEVPLKMLIDGEYRVIGTSTISTDERGWVGESTIDDPELFAKMFPTPDVHVGSFSVEVTPGEHSFMPREAVYIPPTKIVGD